MKTILAAMLVSVCSVAVACGDAPSETASSDVALTNATPAYYVLVRVNNTKNAGDAFIAPAIGGTMKCAGGNTASSCLATLDTSAVTGADGVALNAAEATAAKASFLAGNAIVNGTFGKSGNVLAATKAWSSVGSTNASTAKLWLMTPSGRTFKDTELGSTSVRYAATINLANLALASGVEASLRAEISTHGAIVRGTHHGSGTSVTMGADAVYTQIAHVGAAGTGLTADQETTALHDIDNTCGDTWCDGDYNFRFDTLTCDFTAGTCTIGLAVTYPNDGAPDAKWYPGSCALAGPYHSFSDLILVMTPTYSTITDTLNNQMYDCTQAVEATVPK